MNFKYLKKIPRKSQDTSKVIIMLHWIGSNMDDLFGLENEFSENDYIFSLNWINKYFSWYSRYEAEFFNNTTFYDYNDVISAWKYIADFIKYLKNTYNLENREIYLFWFSQWTIMSYYTLLYNPELISWVIWCSWRILKEYLDLKTDLSNKKLFIWHWSFDEVIWIDKSLEVKKIFEKLNTGVTLRNYPINHTISNEEINDILEFLQ